MKTYTTTINDRLDRICEAAYGSTDTELVSWLIEKNPGLERQGILLRPGLTIKLPPLPTTTQKTPAILQIELWS